MPGFDKTGPMGMGPKTGKGLGHCGFDWHRLLGQARGLCRCCCYACCPQTKKDKTQALKDYQKSLQQELDSVKKKLAKVGK